MLRFIFLQRKKRTHKMANETMNPESMENFIKCEVEDEVSENCDGEGKETHTEAENGCSVDCDSEGEEPYIKDTDVSVMITDEKDDISNTATENDTLIKEEIKDTSIKEEIKAEPKEYDEVWIGHPALYGYNCNETSGKKLSESQGPATSQNGITNRVVVAAGGGALIHSQMPISQRALGIKKRKRSEGQKFYLCKICNLTLVRNDAIAHKVVHPDDKCFECHMCLKLFDKINSLDKHITRHNGQLITCHVCGKTFASNASLKTHLSIHTGEKPHKCDQCNRCFREIVTLRSHQRIHTGEKPFQCLECDKRFRTPGNLSTHKRVHTDHKPHQCKICGKTFALSQGMKRHEKRHFPSKNTTKPYQCDDCGKCFKEPVYLRRHKKIHLIELGLLTREETVRKEYVCDVEECNCGSIFLSNASLKRHRLIIKGEKNFFCDICEKGFITQDYLRKHSKCHDEDQAKRHQCLECGKLFGMKQQLDRHKVKHLTERPSFHCGICNKPFLTEFYVKKHSMKQHGTV